MGGRSLIMTLVGLILISSTMFIVLLRSSDEMATNYTKYYSRQAAQNIAQSGVNLALRQLSNDNSWRTGWTSKTMMGGVNRLSLQSTTFSGRNAVKITSVGILGGGSTIFDWESSTSTLERRDTTVAYFALGFIPGPVKGAITTNNPVLTLGNLTVDGRDHNLSGTLIANQGTLGIWTTGTFTRSGNSKIGGTDSATHVDYAPAKPADSHTFKQGQTWPGGYPATPDGVLGGASNGFPDGFLKSVAQSGSNGSQYVTDPSRLSYPLRGVTFVELPSGGTWQSMDITGSGILVVHNDARNAIMKNLNSGTFTGLMIVDDPVHIHTSIIGALVGLTPSPSEGNTVGNGNGSVMYCSQAISNATSTAGAAGSGSDANVIAWWE